MSTSRLKICLVFFVVLLAAMYNFMWSNSTNSAVQVLQVTTDEGLVSIKTSESKSTDLLQSHLSDEGSVKKLVCDNDSIALHESTVIYKKALLRKTSLAFKEKLTDEGFSRPEIERAAQLLGVDLRTFKRVSATYDFNWANLLPIDGSILRFSVKQKSVVMQSLISRDYSKVVNNARTGELTNNHFLGSNPLLAGLILDNPQIKLSQVEQLIDAGLVPGIADLIKVSSNKEVPTATIQLLERFNRDSLKITWFNNYQDYTLVMLAAQMLNVELLELWINKGVPAYANENDLTAIDILPVPKKPSELIVATKIFEVLAAQNVMAYDIATISRLKQWLPQATVNQYSYYFEQYQIPTISAQQLLDNHQFKVTMAEVAQQLSWTENELVICQQLLASKNKHIQVKKALVNSPLYEMDEAAQQIAFKLLNTMNKNDWEGLQDEFRNLSSNIDENRLLNFILLQAIQSKAPFEKIKALMDQGAKLADPVIFILILQKNISLAKKLYPYGLNLHAKDLTGRSTLAYTILSGKAVSMFKYLLVNGVSVKGSDDLLGLLLSKKYIKNKVVYAKLLIDYGHELTERHRIQLKTIELKNPQEYVLLASLFGI